jgi:hypothetical protein
MDLAGKLTDVILFFFLRVRLVFFLSRPRNYQRKEQQTNWNVPPPLHAVLVEIARLADEKQTPESKRVADLSRVRFSELFFVFFSHRSTDVVARFYSSR